MDIREKLAKLMEDCEFESFHRSTAELLADYLTANGVTIQEWIPASRLPKDTCEYFIAYKAGGDHSYSTGYYDGKCWRSAVTDWPIHPTHWMHILEAPKG